MVETVVNANEISLNTVHYKLAAPVQAELISQYPQKTVIGDVTKDSHNRLSVLSMNNWQGGFGLDRIRGGQGLDRTYLGNSTQTLYDIGAFLPFTRGGVTSNIAGKIAINEWNGVIYIVFGASIRKVTATGGTLSSELDTIPGTTPTVTDSINFILGGTEYLALAHYDSTGGAYGYSYTSDGAAFTDDATDVKYFTFWDDRLWGIDNTGQLWFSTAIGTEVNDAKLPLPAGDVTALFTGPDAEGQEIIYCATKVGLYAHDAANAKFYKTGLTYPRQTNGGLSARTWNAAIYVPVGMAVYKYSPQEGIVTSVGPDKDSGVLAANQGYIQKLIPTENLLFAQTNLASITYVYAYNGRGWGHWYSCAVPTSGGDMHISSVWSYRLWLGQTLAVEFIVLPIGQYNPEQDTTLAYGASGNLLTPWFDADQLEIDKLAVRLRVETANPTTDETVTMSYQIDQGTMTAVGSAVTTAGVTTITFPGNVSTDAGLAFKRIRFQAALARGATTTKTPIVKSLILEYRKKIPDKWGHIVQLNLAGDFGGKTVKEQRAALLTAIQSNTLLEFTYQDTSGTGKTFYVDVVAHKGISPTSGTDERGMVELTLVEV